MKKRILAVVLCVAMLLSVVPFTLTAGAADTVDDGVAGYFMDLYDDITTNPYIAYSAGTSPAGIAELGAPSSLGTLCKDSEGVHTKQSGYARLFLREFTDASGNKETFIEFDRNEAVTGCVNQTVAADTITTGANANGLYSSIDRTNLSHIAFRIKIEDQNNTRSGFYMYINGRNMTSTLATAYMIDKATGAISTPETWTRETSKHYIFEGAFDGWVVVPIDVYGKDGNEVYNIVKGSNSGRITFQLHMHSEIEEETSGHGTGEFELEGWDDKILYIGDILLLENDKFFQCSVAGHVEGTAATCKDKAVCSVCGQSYGEVDADAHGTNTELRGVVAAECGKPGHTGDTWCKDCNTEIEKGKATDALTHKGGEATCSAKAICELCKQEYGEVKADNHKNTELKNKKDATCEAEGYTGDTWCKDCNTEIEKGKVTDALTHKGGEATCSAKAICELCKQAYGEVKADNHKNTELKNKKDATCEAEGYSGDTWCKDCEKEVKKGEAVKKLDHVAADELANKKDATTTEKGYTGDKVCKECGTVMQAGKEIPVIVEDNKDDTTTGGENADNDNAGAGSEDEGTTAPETGDNASVLVAVLVALMAGAVVVLAKKRALNK